MSMFCYGTYFPHKQSCKDCEHMEYCKIASYDKPIISGSKVYPMFGGEGNIPDCSGEKPTVGKDMDRSYSLEELMEVVRNIVNLSPSTLKYLKKLMGGMGCTFAEVARSEGISRQAVHKALAQDVERYPWLLDALTKNTMKAARIKQNEDKTEI